MSRKKNPLTRQDPAAQKNRLPQPKEEAPCNHSWKFLRFSEYNITQIFECRHCGKRSEPFIGELPS